MTIDTHADTMSRIEKTSSTNPYTSAHVPKPLQPLLPPHPWQAPAEVRFQRNGRPARAHSRLGKQGAAYAHELQGPLTGHALTEHGRPLSPGAARVLPRSTVVTVVCAPAAP